MIFVTGDIHSKPHRFSTDIFFEQKEMTKDDYVIILGDFGLVWNFESESKMEKFWLDWLENKPFTTLFLSGNHENYDRLDAYPVEEWNGGKVQKIRPSVIHLMRGQIYTLQGHTFYTQGGASSHDVCDGILELDDPNYKLKKKRLDQDPYALYRVNHLSWWERELPSEEELQEGLENLAKHDNKVDYILAHSPSTSLLMEMDDGSYQIDRLTEHLQYVTETVEHKYFLFGHMHENRNFPEKKAACLYEQIIRLL